MWHHCNVNKYYLSYCFVNYHDSQPFLSCFRLVMLKSHEIAFSVIVKKKFNRSKHVISRIVKLYDDNGSKSPKVPGHSHKKIPQQNQVSQRYSTVDGFERTAGIKHQVIKEFSMKVSQQTVLRCLCKAAVHMHIHLLSNFLSARRTKKLNEPLQMSILSGLMKMGQCFHK